MRIAVYVIAYFMHVLCIFLHIEGIFFKYFLFILAYLLNIPAYFVRILLISAYFSLFCVYPRIIIPYLSVKMHIPVLQIPCTGQLWFHFTATAAYQQYIAHKHTHRVVVKGQKELQAPAEARVVSGQSSFSSQLMLMALQRVADGQITMVLSKKVQKFLVCVLGFTDCHKLLAVLSRLLIESQFHSWNWLSSPEIYLATVSAGYLPQENI